jgi:DNA-binding transcriptional MerR regulator
MRTELVTKKGAAFLLGVSSSRLTYYAKEGMLMPTKTGSKINYKVEDIETFLLRKERRRLN